MAFTVEDGTGIEGANSYVDVAYADAYHSDRGNASWTGDAAVKQAALVKATDYVEQKYPSWVGDQVFPALTLSWPRSNVAGVGANEIPTQLKQAICLLALEALTDDLNPALERAVKREKVDVIEVEYMDNALPYKRRPAIDGLLRGYITGTSLNGKAIRV